MFLEDRSGLREAVRIGARSAFFSWLIVSLVPGTALASNSACSDATYGGRVIAVSGVRFPALAGRRETDLRAWAWHDGRAQGVPFQVDECDADGRILMPPATGPVVSPTLGARSVALFRWKDAGDRAPGPSSGEAFEIELSTDGARGWIYFGPNTGSIPLSATDDVDYDPVRDRVEGQRYTLQFDSPQIGYFAVADGKRRERENLLDRLKARVEAHVFWGMISFRRNEDQVRETVLGFRDGTIRVVRRARLEVDVGWGLPSPQVISDSSFFSHHAEAPLTVSVPFPLGYVFGDLDVRIYLDFRRLDGFRVLAEGLDQPRRVGPGGTVTSLSPTTWFLLGGSDFALLHRLRFGPGLDTVQSRLYYLDDAAREDGPESVVGLRPGIGYHLTRWDSVPRGRHKIWMDTHVLPPDAVEDPEASLEALDRPVRHRVRPHSAREN